MKDLLGVLGRFFRSDLWMALAAVVLAYLMGYLTGRMDSSPKPVPVVKENVR